MTGRYSFLEFFAGGGMARLGLGDSWNCRLSNDIDSQKCAAYRANFGEGDLIERDIASLCIDDLPAGRTDLMWGSFPCQDLSLAGGRRGIMSKRSGLFFEFLRLAAGLDEERRAPRIIAVENVIGLLTSNSGGDFMRVVEEFSRLGYRMTAMMLDAERFTPQSRPRLFIIGFAPDAAPPALLSSAPETAPAALRAAVDRLSDEARTKWIWLAPQPQRRRNLRLSDIIDWDAENWHSTQETHALISMMSEGQRARINAIIKSNARRAGAGFRRTRQENGKPVQRFEARFDGLAGCLRTPAGGSSRQIVIAVENGRARTRLMSPREAAQLMGLPDHYQLPDGATAALKLCGDGVCVPVVQWLAENIFEPALAKAARQAA